MWEPNPDPYLIDVKDPEKKSKFKGIKSFTAYHVIPSSTGRAVSRRYKHYDWLHERMIEKFTLNAVPPLPDKQYYGEWLDVMLVHTCTLTMCNNEIRLLHFVKD